MKFSFPHEWGHDFCHVFRRRLVNPCVWEGWNCCASMFDGRRQLNSCLVLDGGGLRCSFESRLSPQFGVKHAE